MHFVTIIEMSKATLLIGTGTFLWIRGNGYEERFFFFFLENSLPCGLRAVGRVIMKRNLAFGGCGVLWINGRFSGAPLRRFTSQLCCLLASCPFTPVSPTIK